MSRKAESQKVSQIVIPSKKIQLSPSKMKIIKIGMQRHKLLFKKPFSKFLQKSKKKIEGLSLTN